MTQTSTQLIRTKEYNRFKRIDANREVNKAHLKKLVESIKSRNLLHLYPLIVNERFEIIDGQHRLKAAEQLGCDVYYLLDPNVTKADIAMMNNNRKGWSGRDYIGFYAKDGKKEYQLLQKLLNDYPKITIGTGQKLLDKDTGAYYTSGGNYTQILRNGQIDASNHKVGFAVAKVCDELHKKRYYAFSGAFMVAMKGAMLKSGKSLDECSKLILSKRHVLPSVKDETDSLLPLLKEILNNQ